MNLDPPAGQPQWMFRLFRKIEAALSGPQQRPFQLVSYTVVELPPASKWMHGLVYVPDEAGGAVIAFSDGSDWRRVTDRAVVS